jgi:predicted metal-dependent HD superfamily phosphohydrolase
MDHWRFHQNAEAFAALVAAYSETARHYHTLEHLEACLGHLDSCAHLTDFFHEVELALWFHDAVYKPLSSENESKSAKWAESFLADNGASMEQISRVRSLVMATKHEQEPNTQDESILQDIDLSILGADPETYTDFEKGVRSEYRLVPSFIFRKKRADLLGRFLARPQIYQNEPFRSSLEAQARKNVAST